MRAGKPRAHRGSRRLCATLLASVVLVAGCTSGDGGEPPAKDEPPKARITAEPAADARDVSVLTPVKLTVADGTLTEAAVTNAEGKSVAGAMAPDGRSWSTTEVLGYGKTYTYTAKATGTDNKPVELRGSFTTVTPRAQVRATLNPDNTTVGVAMPISVKFDSPPADKATVERALKVETSVPVEGGWAWLHDKQVDWRPKEYWPAGTKVNVSAKLYGVHYGNGAYGRSDVNTSFTIGRNQVVKIHTPSHQLTVWRDGRQVASYPASFGRDANPDLNTPNGTFIVMEKKPRERFDNARYGYTNVWKNWAVRFSNHGEYIHENEENRANIGRANTSHGCANLTEADAKAYYDWLIPWSQWQTMSALR